LGSISDQVLTITSDNGKEFANHEQIAKRLKCDFYFAHPYSSYERGTNENTNGLIRQYFPKNRDFRTITDSEIIRAMKRLNNRPRKRLGYKTPNEVFFGESFNVALTT
jgi:IS30 family transposase